MPFVGSILRFGRSSACLVVFRTPKCERLNLKIRRKTNYWRQLRIGFSRLILAAVLPVFGMSIGFGACIQFLEQSIPLDGYPAKVALTDMNRDGKLDVVVVGQHHWNSPSNWRGWILLGQGDGTFMVRTNFVLPVAPQSYIAVGDWNSDGNPDLAFTSISANAGLVTFLGNEDGTIRAADQSAVRALGTVVAGDFNRDNRPDLVATAPPDGLIFLRGNGDGTFQPGVPFGSNFTSVAVVDFNKDGNLDIIALGRDPGVSVGTNQSAVSLFEGRGDGSFQLKQSYPVGISPLAMTTADHNGDQIADIVVSNYLTTKGQFGPDPSVSVLLGKKDGTFSGATNYRSVVYPQATRAADINSDGVLDLVVAQGEGLAFFIGVGDGTFQPVQFLPGSGEMDVSTGDFNGDGKADLFVADYSQGSVRTYISACGFRPKLSFRRTDGGLLLFWPTFVPFSFHLESSASFAAPTWRRVTDVFPENRNGRQEALIPTTKAERFFRLAQ